MLSTRKRSMFKMMKPQTMPPIIATGERRVDAVIQGEHH